MAPKRKNDSGHDASEATTKLSRLLETELELDAMLKDTRQEAKGLVQAAQKVADDRVNGVMVAIQQVNSFITVTCSKVFEI